jgi:regulatory protein
MQDLFAKGVSTNVAEQAWQQYEAENTPVDEEAQILELLRKKKFDVENADYKERVKMMNYLYRKGYSFERINGCIQSE